MNTTIIISGVTGAGKTTLANELLLTHGIARIITATTREPRAGEVHGKDYYFMSDREFEAVKRSGGFAETNVFSGAKYGVLIADLQKDAIKVVIVDPNGHRNVKASLKAKGLPYLSVFLDCHELIQSKRQLDRIMTEVSAAKHAGRFHVETLNAAAERMENMLTVEAHWRDVARAAESPYDLYVRHLNDGALKELAQSITDRAKLAAA